MTALLCVLAALGVALLAWFDGYRHGHRVATAAVAGRQLKRQLARKIERRVRGVKSVDAAGATHTFRGPV